MNEVWLKSNRRAIWFGCVPPLVLAAVGIWMALGAGGTQLWRGVGIALTVLGVAVLGMLLVQLFRPRIAYRDGHVLVYLRWGAPIAVPAEVVEAFFLGQGPAHLPGGIKNQPQTVNLVARLSQRRAEWAKVEVKPALGNWAEGYITIRGTWCEPLHAELVRRLNHRLKEVKSLNQEARER